MTAPTRRLLAGAAALAAVAIAVFHSCRPMPTPIPPKEQTSIDSLHATKPAFDSSHAAAKAAGVTMITKLVRDSAGVAAALREADHWRHVADSIAASAAAQADTASPWHAVAEARDSAVTVLRDSLASAGRDLVQAKDSISRLVAHLDADADRMGKLEELQARLAADLRRADPPCRFALGLFGCPSRKTVAVVTAITAAGVTVVATNDRARHALVHLVVP